MNAKNNVRKPKTLWISVNFLSFVFSITAIPNGTNPSTPSQNGQNGNDEDGEVMNNLMSDIQNGFVHRRLPDGGFKVRIIIILIIFLH